MNLKQHHNLQTALFHTGNYPKTESFLFSLCNDGNEPNQDPLPLVMSVRLGIGMAQYDGESLVLAPKQTSNI